jgi:pro-apoptotic serine protease NMA111
MGATDFFLPLDRVQRALTCLQQGLPITRGTIQTAWSLRPFDECKRLGLTPKHEGRMRDLFPDAIGLLVAETVLPEGTLSELTQMTA